MSEYESSQMYAGSLVQERNVVEDYIAPEGDVDPRLYDLKWRLNNLYWVVNEDGELVKFNLRPAQEALLDGLHYRDIILKARQLGFTTFICIFFLDLALFHKHKQIGIIAHTEDDAKIIFRKVKVAWENFPKKLKDQLHLSTTGDSKVEYEFSNGSVIRVSTSLRSGTYQAVLITEFGKISKRFPEKAKEIITGTLPAVPGNGIVFIESTAEGDEGHYYDMSIEAMEREENPRPLAQKEFKFFFFPWYKNPRNVVPDETDMSPDIVTYLNELEQKLKISLSNEQRWWYQLEFKIQRDMMKQEHPSTPEEAFASTGNKLFNPDYIQVLMDRLLNLDIRPTFTNGELKIFKIWQKGHRYVLGADVAEGVGKDSSTIAVIDLTTGELVATYRNKTIDPVNFAYEIAKVGALYGTCLVMPEVNNHGHSTVATLKGIYPKIYMHVVQGVLEEKPTNKIGWLTGAGNKATMAYELKDALETGDLVVLDKVVLMEAKKFSVEDTRITRSNEDTTRHFDLLTAVMIAWQGRSYATSGTDPEQEARIMAHRERVQKAQQIIQNPGSQAPRKKINRYR